MTSCPKLVLFLFDLTLIEQESGPIHPILRTRQEVMLQSSSSPASESYHVLTLGRSTTVPMTAKELNKIVDRIQKCLVGDIEEAYTRTPGNHHKPPRLSLRLESLHEISQVLKVSLPCSEMQRSDRILKMLATENDIGPWRPVEIENETNQMNSTMKKTCDLSHMARPLNPAAIHATQFLDLTAIPSTAAGNMTRNFSGSTAHEFEPVEEVNDWPLRRLPSDTNIQPHTSPATFSKNADICLGCNMSIGKSDALDHMSSCQELSLGDLASWCSRAGSDATQYDTENVDGKGSPDKDISPPVQPYQRANREEVVFSSTVWYPEEVGEVSGWSKIKNAPHKVVECCKRQTVVRMQWWFRLGSKSWSYKNVKEARIAPMKAGTCSEL